MNRTLFTSHYTLIAIAALTTAFFHPTFKLAVYTFLILLYTALDTIYYQWLHHLPAFRKAWFPLLQVLFATFLHLQYEGYMYLLYFSILILLRPGPKHPFDNIVIALQWILFNVVLLKQPLELHSLLLNNILYLVMIGALLLINEMFSQKEKIQSLYDTLRERHYELEKARSQLLEHARLVEIVAQTEERNRIAKDIHDELGHQLVRMKMMTEAVLHMLPENREKGMALLYEVRDQLAHSIESLRKTVQRLKPDDTEVHSMSLGKLANDFSRDSGVRVELAQSGQVKPLLPSVEVVLYRNAREALTNAVLHGDATHIWMRLHFGRKHVKLIISNNGELPTPPLRMGLGIRGMKERAELVGGHVEIKIDEYFEIITTVPLSTISIR